MKHLYIIMCLCFLGAACTTTKHFLPIADQPHNNEPNYSQMSYWAAHPYKYDYSDSVPAPLKTNYHIDSTADVFFIHPTTFTEMDRQYMGKNASLLDTALNQKTDASTILYQASVFNAAGRVFAPRYRQANLINYFYENEADSLLALQAFQLAYHDVKQAFLYYLQHFNIGRPIIIASHSQGTTHAKWLLRDFFDNDSVMQRKLIVAYLVGIPVEPNWFSNLKPCITPQQTECFCSWRTMKRNFLTPFVQKETYSAIVTNPISWDASIPSVKRNQNAGSLLYNFNKLNSNVADAIVHKGVLWTRKPHFLGNILLTTKNYHIADYNLYYLNIRQNVQLRKEAFFNKTIQPTN